ncbi:serine/threonine-protein kinase [Actinoplanes sp. L3-i22]|uniref:serine/threonine-protein kinase n=1 Tax=Actinoplanes sp. L3-i22 TaxID=2836373 RepID=UPI001C84AB8B|nr:serine/threonine-protein kinase [Actinoplanes sp. L3-i22]
MDEGQRLGGRYLLHEELGRGGMAVVWRATDEVLHRPVAVKVLAGRYAADHRFRSRILHEARAAATLSHPNIAQIHDFGESDEDGTLVPYVVMELINGPTLQQRLAEAPMPPRRVFRICGEVAAALAAAHEDGLVHRDIKLANVMVTPSGAKVVDFGIAAAAGPAEPEEGLLGTPAYLAPERLTGGAIEPASDVYALGVLLFRLLADESPWTVETTTQMLSAHMYAEPMPLPELPGVPPGVAELVDRCLAKDPADRPSAAEVSAILGDAAEAVSITAQHAGAAAAPVPDPPAPAPVEAEVEPAEIPEFEAGMAKAPKLPPTRFDDATEMISLGRLVAPQQRARLLLAGGVMVALLILVAGVWVTREGDPRPAGIDAAPPASRAAGPPGVARSAGATPSPSGTRPDRRAAAVTSELPASANPSIPGSAAPSAVPEPSAGDSAPPTSDVPESTRLESKGGAVYAICVSGNAQILSWEPAEGFVAERVDPGPGLTASVVFAGGLSRYRMSITCFAGKPSAVVLPL